MSGRGRTAPAQTGIAGRPSGPFIVGLRVLFDPESDDRSWADIVGPLAVDADHDALERPASYLEPDGVRVPLPWILGGAAPSGRSKRRRIAPGKVKASAVADLVATYPDPWDVVGLEIQGLPERVSVKPQAFYRAPEAGRIDAVSSVSAAAAGPVAARRLERLRAFARCEAVQSGFVHVDTTHDPYGEVFRADLTAVPERFVPGYYWAVLLTQHHLEALGGAEAVRRQAPLEIVETVERAQPALLCIVTESPDDLTEERVLAWREYLGPLLPWGIASSLEDVGQLACPLQRPVWLFEGPPLPRQAPRYLRGNPPGSEAVPRPDDALDLRVPATFPDDPSGPEVARCVLPLGPRFDAASHAPTLIAIVDTWALMGRDGELRDLDGRLRRLAEAPEITGGPAAPALEWAFVPGEADLVLALQILHAALAPCDRALGPEVITHTITVEFR